MENHEDEDCFIDETYLKTLTKKVSSYHLLFAVACSFIAFPAAQQLMNLPRILYILNSSRLCYRIGIVHNIQPTIERSTKEIVTYIRDIRHLFRISAILF